MKEYILKSSKMCYGLTYSQIRKMAYDYAKLLNCQCPESWEHKKTAGIDWLKGFMKRHEELSLRKPENTSLSRATSFNKTNLAEFQANFEQALRSYAFTPENIYNLDETGITTVVQAPNIVARKGTKQVGQIVSAERGQLITMCGIVNASGNSIPPVFVFPRARFHDTMLSGAPVGSLGLVNSPTSGWMTGPLFLKVLEHIQKFTRCSKENKILILMDNHESHCTLDAIVYARDHGMVLVTFPPHCTHRLQPLDVSVMGPFKTKLSVAQNDWLLNHPGKTITIHDLPALANTAYVNTFTMKNIIAGFAKPGIWPFSRNAFSDEDFEAASVTNRDLPLHETEALPEDAIEASSNDAKVSYSNNNEPSTSSQIENFPITPEMVRPLPKAEPRSKNKVNRRRKKSRILTYTPEKEKIEEETLARLSKNKKRKPVLNWKRRPVFVPPSSSKNIEEDSSDDSDPDNYSVHDESDDYPEQATTEEQLEPENLKKKDFVLVRFLTKTASKYYVGEIIQKYDAFEYKIKYLKRGINKQHEFLKFYFPDKPDVSDVNIDDIVKKLPTPTSTGGTNRTKAIFTFNVDLSTYNIV
jgi:hypothetical protein